MTLGIRTFRCPISGYSDYHKSSDLRKRHRMHSLCSFERSQKQKTAFDHSNDGCEMVLDLLDSLMVIFKGGGVQFEVKPVDLVSASEIVCSDTF